MKFIGYAVRPQDSIWKHLAAEAAARIHADHILRLGLRRLADRLERRTVEERTTITVWRIGRFKIRHSVRSSIVTSA